MTAVSSEGAELGEYGERRFTSRNEEGRERE
jgi:hypothetical protein